MRAITSIIDYGKLVARETVEGASPRPFRGQPLPNVYIAGLARVLGVLQLTYVIVSLLLPHHNMTIDLLLGASSMPAKERQNCARMGCPKHGTRIKAARAGWLKDAT